MKIIKKGKIVVLVMFVYLLNMSAVVNGAEKQLHLQKVGDGIVQEINNDRMWISEKTMLFSTIDDVNEYLATLNKGVYSDWRLPTKFEMLGLYDIFDFKLNGDVKMQLEGNYWVRDEAGETVVGAWEIGDQCDPERFFYLKTIAGRVRAVRP